MEHGVFVPKPEYLKVLDEMLRRLPSLARKTLWFEASPLLRLSMRLPDDNAKVSYTSSFMSCGVPLGSFKKMKRSTLLIFQVPMKSGHRYSLTSAYSTNFRLGLVMFRVTGCLGHTPMWSPFRKKQADALRHDNLLKKHGCN